jgi:hypothetical protein
VNLNEDLELLAWSQRPFTSTAFQLEAMSGKRYKTDPMFRSCVERKLALTSGVGIGPVVHNNKIAVVVTAGIGSDSDTHLASELKSLDDQMVERYGAEAVAPPPVEKPKEPTLRERSSFFSKAIDGGESTGISTRHYPAF